MNIQKILPSSAGLNLSISLSFLNVERFSDQQIQQDLKQIFRLR